MKRKQDKPKTIYTVYRRGEYAVEGTAEQCAKVLGLTRASFMSAVSRVNKGTNRKYEFMIYHPRKKYAFYDADGNRKASGTVHEIAAQLGLSESHVYRITNYGSGTWDTEEVNGYDREFEVAE